MPKRMNLVGQKFNMLTVLEFYDVQNGMSRWLCQCDCGKILPVYGRHLKSGNTMSCGCYHKAHNKEYNYKHGESGTRLYNIWGHMKSRCNNPNKKTYRWYGGKGIKVCDQWKDFTNFREWALNNGYKENLTIDRIDSNKNYCPENCQWLTMKENNDKDRRRYAGIAFNSNGEKEEFNSLKEFAQRHNYRVSSVQTSVRLNKKYKDWNFILY